MSEAAEQAPDYAGHSAALNAPILDEDYPIYGDYAYVADGEVVLSNWHGITAREFRLRLGAKELRRYDLAGRMAAESQVAA